MEPFTNLNSRVIQLIRDDIDTDQIIPARFLKVTDKAGLGEKLFFDWRYHDDGSPKADFVLNRPESQGCRILLAGDNFGCGSSREHAPWALMDWGIRAVVATSFADIFRNNALKNGLLPVAITHVDHRVLRTSLENSPDGEIGIDLDSQSMVLSSGSAEETLRITYFEVDGFAKKCLLMGMDQLGYLLSHADRIDAFEQDRQDANNE